MSEEMARRQQAQKFWLAGVLLARVNLHFLRPILLCTHVLRHHMARVLQRHWKMFRAKLGGALTSYCFLDPIYRACSDFKPSDDESSQFEKPGPRESLSVSGRRTLF
jgi:hypothetical protein